MGYVISVVASGMFKYEGKERCVGKVVEMELEEGGGGVVWAMVTDLVQIKSPNHFEGVTTRKILHGCRPI